MKHKFYHYFGTWIGTMLVLFSACVVVSGKADLIPPNYFTFAMTMAICNLIVSVAQCILDNLKELESKLK